MKQEEIRAEANRLFQLALTDRGALLRRLGRIAGVVRASVVLRGCELGSFVNVQGPLRVVCDGTIRLAQHVEFRGGMFPSEIVAHAGAEITVGESTMFNYGVSIEAAENIRIGARCMVASMVRICDAGERGASPIVIGDEVWLAHGSVILPGVHIGDGSVVSAGSVVRSNVPPKSLAAGNPAVSAPLSSIRQRPQDAR